MVHFATQIEHSQQQCPARSENEEDENLIISFLEVKSENASRSRSEISQEFSRNSQELRKFLDFVKYNHYKCCIWVLYIAHFLHMTCIISLFSRNEM